MNTNAVAHSQQSGHRLTVEDVLRISHIDRVSISPDGNWIAVVLSRPALKGEVYGRNAYETDPSRNDVWLVSRLTGEKRNLTNGRVAAAGFWCATWSPDGRKLAMLSTMPQGNEPRGGDNVRLYVWDERTDTVSRLSDAPVMTQTRYGSPFYSLDVRAESGRATASNSCRENDENSPFVWLDNNKVLAVMMPDGQISALIDEYKRSFDHAKHMGEALAKGVEPTFTSVGSGAERMASNVTSLHAVVRIIDVTTKVSSTVANVPAYPFQGALSLSLSPDRKRMAILASINMIQLRLGDKTPYHDDSWQVEKRLGFVDLTEDAEVHWVDFPPEGRYPVELLSWGPDGKSVALRARAAATDSTTFLFVATSKSQIAERVSPSLLVGDGEAGPYAHEVSCFWLDEARLLVRGKLDAASRFDWWIAQSGKPPINATHAISAAPSAIRRAPDGSFVAISGSGLARFNKTKQQFYSFGTSLPANSVMLWPNAADWPASDMLVSTSAKGTQVLHQISLESGELLGRLTLPANAELLDFASKQGIALWSRSGRLGISLHTSQINGKAPKKLLQLNEHLAAVDWGRVVLINYRSLDGEPLKAAVILPPGYIEGHRYPTITWVYPGYVVRDEQTPFADALMPGIYNLQLYAARGYVVLIPSMPVDYEVTKRDSYQNFTKGVLPAVDRLINEGIADPNRLGVMGQSGGGYAVYGLVTQTGRFKAAIALAGITDLAQFFGQFAPTARGYPGIEHQASANWSILEKGLGLDVPPYEDYSFYWRNSPIAYVDRVKTPLLMIHGELDKRGAMVQAETFFFSLFRQGKTARLLRYWGESHSLAQSPANVRSIVDEVIAWFDKYLAAPLIRKEDK